MRLLPINKPSSLLLKLAYFFSKKKFGKVLAPLKVIYARSKPVMMASLKIINTEKKLSLPKELRTLIRFYTSHLNECSFCSDVIAYTAARESAEFREWKEVMNFRNSTRFTDREKSLLAYLEEVNVSKTATDETFGNLKKYFSDKEIVELTWLNATEHYFNLMAKPLGLTSDELQYRNQ